MSELPVPRKPLKPPPGESELSQILAHARACRDAFGPHLGALVVIVTVIKARPGYLGVASAVSIASGVFYHFWKQ
ncbi:hypothetical protein M2175_005797 [Bradyrhizobium elkanii]|jgi:hypothetical protein|uniref:hypothetical protein n=1 Tax=Bradyrhizobium TaxID=374 RepID=UPI00216968D4|nr:MULTISPECIES: hypothetical protein [Bradyrhizobium]MCS3930766.1 hypothetical protein [Bradyrhizobium elkanii]MCS3971323.1 hypothetical protein [Bradyrhizobium japonicum]